MTPILKRFSATTLASVAGALVFGGLCTKCGVGTGQAGVGYSGGVGVNLGGPVNRVGVR